MFPKFPVFSRSRTPRARGVIAAAIAAAVALSLAGLATPSVADTVPTAPTPATVSADALPTVQVNGVVWAQVVVGTTVYATGNFTQARPAGVAVGGTGTVTRSNLLAYNITTGVLIPTFNHALNAQGLAISASPDGSTVYVGGTFTAVDGVARNRIAAFTTATGALLSTFAPSFNNTVRAVVASSTAVYAGGDFTVVGSSARNHVASVTAAGAVVSTFNPGANLAVVALTLTPDKTRLIVGGRFGTLAGVAAIGMGSVDAVTGASRPWAANTVIKDQGSGSAIYSLSSDSTQVYGTGYFFTIGGNFEGRFAANPNTGAIIWMNNCHGDSYSSFPIGPVLYSVGHAHECSDIGGFSQDDALISKSTTHRALAEATAPSGALERHAVFISGPNSPTYHDFFGQPITNQLDWYPTLINGTFTGQGQAAWSVSGNSQYVVLGGEFPIVNNASQQGLVRFAISPIAPNKVAPTKTTSFNPLLSSQSPGTMRVAWQSVADRDNNLLTYALFRDAGTTPIYTTTASTTFWQVPNLGFVDTGLAAGSVHTYKVTARDPFGNTITSSSVSATVGSASPNSYTTRVRNDGASHFWPLSESSGTLAIDRAGFSDVTLGGAITHGAAGPIAGGGTGLTFQGGETTPAGATAPVPNDTAGTIATQPPSGAFSVEAWFKTTSGSGGGIVNLGLYAAKSSVNIDKALYLDAAGRVHFAVQNDLSRQGILSAGTFRNGAWHHAVGTFSGSTEILYVDGVLVASRSGVSDNIAFPGFWRIGGDNLAGWPNRSGNYLAGSIADVAIYPTALTAAVVVAHYAARLG
ncbi:MAG: cell surface protein [Glaciihabitans sp.]|nr:cell surface protein [Glaciihabitans sp.]